MSKKARTRPTWKNKRRKIPRKYQTARYRLPYNKYWTVSFYGWFDAMAEHYSVQCSEENRKLFVSEYQADIMKKVLFHGT